jgi:Arc/MetJ family transcription regulator
VYTEVYLRTNIVLDDALVLEASRLTGIRTKRALVDEALRALVKAKKRRALGALKGRIRFARGYDYKALRAGK